MTADTLAQFIRQVDGSNTMGAGALAEKIVEWMAAQSPAEGDADLSERGRCHVAGLRSIRARHALSQEEHGALTVAIEVMRKPPEVPTNEALEKVASGHQGHPADFAADVLERWGGWQHGLMGYGGGLNATNPDVQPKGTAVAWSRQQLIHDDDGYSIGADEPELHWGKEPPDDEAGWHPLYAAAGVTTRDAALEEAAQVCERWNTTPGRKLAGEIRALAAQAPAPAPGLNSDDFLQLSAEVWPADAPRTGERAWWPAQLKTQLCPRMADLTHFGALVEREVLRRVSESQAPAVPHGKEQL